jgi:hypothetical protein
VIESEEWEALDPTSKGPVYVEGPFQTPDQVQQYTSTYTGVNLVAAGGLYAVSAALSSHLDFQVDSVAKCLSAATGSGTLSF